MANNTNETLTKRTLLNLLESAEMDAPIEVNVFLDHIVKNGKAAKVTKVRLSNGAGIGGENNGVLLSTVSE